MNIHRNRKNYQATTRKKVVKKSSAIGSIIYTFAMGLSLLLFVLMFLGLYVYFDSHAQRIDQEMIKLSQEIVEVEREIENNTIRIASLKSWAHVNKRIVAYNMELRLPTQRQKYYIALNDNDNSQEQRRPITKTETTVPVTLSSR